MITTGFTLAVLTGLGFFLIYKKLPKSIRNFIQKHVLLSDGIACLLTYVLFGCTLVGLLAAAWLGIILSILLALISNPTTNKLINNAMTKCKEIKDEFILWVETTMKEKANVLHSTDTDKMS